MKIYLATSPVENSLKTAASLEIATGEIKCDSVLVVSKLIIKTLRLHIQK